MGGSEFELVVADEAVLALGGYELPDPMQAFYPELPNVLNAVYGRSTVTVGRPPAAVPAVAGGRDLGRCVGGGLGRRSRLRRSQPRRCLRRRRTRRRWPAVRSWPGPARPSPQRQNFDALALFVPSATTDAQGRRHHRRQAAGQPDPVPGDGRSRWPVHNQFGSAESTITAALPLTVRPSAPTFLNFGDTPRTCQSCCRTRPTRR